MRLIDADVLLGYVNKYDTGQPIGKALRAMLEKSPTVDAVPVKHGKWIPCAKSGLILTEQLRREGICWYGFKCSACNCMRKGNALKEANYCPNCGARMDEE